MIILLKRNADKQQVDSLAKRMTQLNLQIHMSEGSSETIMGLVGDTSAVDIDSLMALDIVEDVKRIQEPYRERQPQISSYGYGCGGRQRQDRGRKFCVYCRPVFG